MVILTFGANLQLSTEYAQLATLNTKFSTEFNQQAFAPYKVNGLLAGQFKNAGTLCVFPTSCL
jgi:hypothetical protein